MLPPAQLGPDTPPQPTVPELRDHQPADRLCTPYPQVVGDLQILVGALSVLKDSEPATTDPTKSQM